MEIESKNRKIKFSKADEEECKRRGYSNIKYENGDAFIEIYDDDDDDDDDDKKSKIEETIPIIDNFFDVDDKIQISIEITNKKQKMVEKVKVESENAEKAAEDKKDEEKGDDKVEKKEKEEGKVEDTIDDKVEEKEKVEEKGVDKVVEEKKDEVKVNKSNIQWIFKKSGNQFNLSVIFN